MNKWSKALAVVTIGVVAGLLAPGSASAASHHSQHARSVVVADQSITGGAQLAVPMTLGWGEQ